MSVHVDISVSLDGYVAGPEPTLEEPLGRGGMGLHEWVFELASWRSRHGREGGIAGPDDELVREANDDVRAVVMGRRMYSGGAGPWEDDPNAGGWWGDEPPFGVPVFVVTHHRRQPTSCANDTKFMFVTDGVEAAIAEARAVAGDGVVSLAGGADVIRQALQAGLVDRIRLHVAPLLLGGGTRLFDGVEPMRLRPDGVLASKRVVHLTYRVGA
jgi:dihydrofolate reductase